MIVLHHGELNISLDHNTTLFVGLLHTFTHTPADISQFRLHSRVASALLVHQVKVCARPHPIHAFDEEQQLGVLY